MWEKPLSALWRRTPRGVRLLVVRLTNARFTVTVGAVALDARGRVLLFNHVFRKGNGWGIPGGFLVKGEQPEEGLRRELREEAGIEVERAELAFVRAHRSPQQVEIIYLCRVRAGAEGALDATEIKGAGWFELDKLPAGMSRDQHSLIERALAAGGAQRAD